MAVHLSLNTDPNRISVKVTDLTYVTTLTNFMMGLLGAKYNPGTRVWSLTWPDLISLRHFLDDNAINGRTADDDAMAWVEAERDADTRMDNIRTGTVVLPKLPLITAKLYPDQLNGVAFMLAVRSGINADEMGLGKTITTLAAYSLLRTKGEPGPLLVICPNAVKAGWLKEISKHTKLTVTVIGNGAESIMDDFHRFLKKPTDVLVVHYQALLPTAKDKEVRKKVNIVWGMLTDALVNVRWAAVALDEAHQVKNLTTARGVTALHLTTTVKNPSGSAPRIWLLTGTPVAETPTEGWVMLQYVDPASVPSYHRFFAHFAVQEDKVIGRGGRTVKAVVGYRRLGDLKAVLHRRMIRRMKIEMKGLPDKIEHYRDVEMTAQQAKVYRMIRNEVKAELKGEISFGDALVKTVRLRQALNNVALIERAGVKGSDSSGKYEALDDIVEEVLADPLQKIVIWTEFREAVKLLAARYAQYGVIQLIGGVTQEELQSHGQNFDTSSDRVVISIPAFGGTGVDFLSRARTAVYVEPPYSTVLYRQSVDRIHRRLNPTSNPTEIDRVKASPANIIFLRCNGTVDDMVFDRILTKADMVDAVLIEDEKLVNFKREDLLAYLR